LRSPALFGLGVATNKTQEDTMTTTTTSLSSTALFPLGVVVSTPGAASALSPGQVHRYLHRHQTGDWGAVCAEDKALNDAAIQDGNRILSAYPIDPALPCAGHGANCVWIITEADRSATTFLLPEEY
jgi:hypothetical protein